MGNGRRRSFTTDPPVSLYCKRVATRREHAREKQGCLEILNGCGALTEDLWLKIFSHFSTGEVVAFCAPVCRAWRNWTYSSSGSTFNFNAAMKCQVCGIQMEQHSRRLPAVVSFGPYIEKRANTLTCIRLSSPKALDTFEKLSIFGSAWRCHSLQHLEVYAPIGEELSAESIFNLPRSLRTFKTSLALQENSLTAWRLDQGIRELDICMRSTPRYDPDSNLDKALLMLIGLQQLERLTIRHYIHQDMPTRDVTMPGLRYLELADAVLPMPSLLDFVLLLKNLEVLNINAKSTMDLDFSKLRQHGRLKSIHVKSRYATLQCVQSLYSLPQTATLETEDSEPVEDLVFASDMQHSNLQRLTVGTSLNMLLDLPVILQAPRLEVIDAWASSFSLGLSPETKKNILPGNRPLCIKLDSDAEFNPEEATALKNLGFTIKHSQPSCACCGTALSSWYAVYMNEQFQEEGLSPTGLPEAKSDDLPCIWGTCEPCKALACDGCIDPQS